MKLQSEEKSHLSSRADTFLSKYANIRWLGVLFFVIVCLFGAYQISQTTNKSSSKVNTVAKLKLVSVFNRHGDRAPADELLGADEHGGSNATLFWPNGLSNLTEEGKFRQYRIGLELRRKYSKFFDLDTNHVLAFSSSIVRCVESLEQTLGGLFSVDQTLEDGLEFTRQVSSCFQRDPYQLGAVSEKTRKCIKEELNVHMPNGPGFPNRWKSIRIDTKSIPVLNYNYLKNCPANLTNKPIDRDLRESDSIRKLAGFERLATLLKQRYDLNFNFTALAWWSSIAAELRLARSWQTLEHGQHFYVWVSQPAAGDGRNNQTLVAPTATAGKSPSLFDLYEQVVTLAYRDRIIGEANYVQLAPLIGSLLQSQLVALGKDGARLKPLLPDEHYKDKKMIFYSTHDSILQLLLHRLQIIDINENEPFEKRWNRMKNSDEVSQLLAGHKMTKFGFSLVFELWQMEASGEQQELSEKTTFEYIQLAVYNREDGKFKPVDYKRVQMGKVCRRLFLRLYPRQKLELDEQFYDEQFKIDQKFSCPLKLFRNVTSAYEFDLNKFNSICEGTM